MTKEKILVSACLIGENCRYDGRSKSNGKVLEQQKKFEIIAVCPERFGGLPTPRNPVEIKNGRAIDCDGNDLTAEFIKGAEEVLKIAKEFNIKKAILKQRSPSCGTNQMKKLDGSIVFEDGLTAGLLRKNGIEVISEEDL